MFQKDFIIAISLFIFSYFIYSYTIYTQPDSTNLNTTSIRQDMSIGWPVNTDKKQRISSTFGESRLDHFHTGLDIAANNIKVYPVSKGRVIWKTEAIHKPGEIPFGGGKTIVMDHDGLWSGYMHLQKITLDKSSKRSKANANTITPVESAEKTMNKDGSSTTNENGEANQLIVSRDVSIGRSGNTGRSGGAHLHFFIFDPTTRDMINPLLLLPDKGLYQNTTPPKRTGLAIRLPDKFAQINANSKFRLSEEFPIYAKLVDSSQKNEKWGIYHLQTYNQESEENPIMDVVFDRVQLINNRWLTSGGLPFEEVFFDNWYNLGSGFKKTSTIILKTSGFQGPTAKEKINLNITQ